MNKNPQSKTSEFIEKAIKKQVDFGGKGEKSANELFEKNKERDDKKLKKCLSNNIEMIYVVDNEKYFEKKYNMDIVEPFSGNVRYKMIYINNFTNFLHHIMLSKQRNMLLF